MPAEDAIELAELAEAYGSGEIRLIRFRMRQSGIDRGTARGRTGKRSDETV